MKVYKINKYFRGGKNSFYVKLKDKPSKKQWPYVLEWIGDNTTGGHNYGYRIEANLSRKKDIPKEQIVKVPDLDNF